MRDWPPISLYIINGYGGASCGIVDGVACHPSHEKPADFVTDPGQPYNVAMNVVTNKVRALAFLVGYAAWMAGAGCSQTKPADNGLIPDGADLPVLRETSDSFSNIAMPLRIVMYDRATFSQFALRPLNVDFDREMVLLAAMGPASSPECAVRIRRVWRDGRRLRVVVECSYPDASVPRRAGSSSPYHAVVVPRCELPIAHFSSVIPQRAFLDKTAGSQ